MELEGSLPQSQVPATSPYPEPARSVHNPTSHFLKIHLNIILPSTPGSPQWSASYSMTFVVLCDFAYDRIVNKIESGGGINELVYCRTVQQTDTNTDPIYAATPPPY